MGKRVLLTDLIDPAAPSATGGSAAGRSATGGLPRGWVPAGDGLHARRDRRLMLREGWVLVLGLVAFGAAGAAFLWGAMPRGWSGAVRLGALVLVVALVGGVVAPSITRALTRR